MILNTLGDEIIAERFINDAVSAMMGELNPTFAGMSRRRMPEGTQLIRVDVDGTETSSPRIAMSAEVSIAREDIVEGNLEALHEFVAHVADSYLSQFMPVFFEHISDAVSAVGNSVELPMSTLSWDDILDSLEHVEWSVDQFDNVMPPTITAGIAIHERLMSQRKTPEQLDRWNRIRAAKQEEHVSRRRSRRLR